MVGCHSRRDAYAGHAPVDHASACRDPRRFDHQWAWVRDLGVLSLGVVDGDAGLGCTLSDRTFREDDSKIHADHLPRIMAGLRNLSIGVHRQDGHTNIAAALRHTARDWGRPLAALGITG